MSALKLQEKWLAELPWEKVLAQHEQFCKTKQHPTQMQETQAQAARQIWEHATQSVMSLMEAVEVCRKCCELGPFMFSNTATFTLLAKRMVDDWIQALPAVEAEITRNTIGHYVAGQIKRSELTNVLHHAEHFWKAAAVIRPMPAPAAPQPTPSIPTVHTEARAS